MDLSELRQDYTKNGIRRQDLDPHPIKQFEGWFDDAHRADLLEANAMTLATVNSTGQPFTRTVLLKQVDADGFVFYTNFESRKATHIAENAKVSLLFTWLPLERQISINGYAARIPSSEALSYFLRRPRGSQIGAWTSKQSSIIKSRALLESKWEEMKRKFSEGDIPLPSFWGGYRVVPHSVEFWQGRQNRLHDRFLYQLEDGKSSWILNRMSP